MANNAMENTHLMMNDPKRPVESVGRGQSVSPEKYGNCLGNGSPTPEDGRSETLEKFYQIKIQSRANCAGLPGWM